MQATTIQDRKKQAVRKLGLLVLTWILLGAATLAAYTHLV